MPDGSAGRCRLRCGSGRARPAPGLAAAEPTCAQPVAGTDRARAAGRLGRRVRSSARFTGARPGADLGGVEPADDPRPRARRGGAAGGRPRHEPHPSSARHRFRHRADRRRHHHLDDVDRQPDAHRAMGRGSVWRICFGATILTALPALAIAGWLVARAFPLRPRLAGALYGLGAGLLADAGWRLFCHFSDPAHVLAAHTAGIAATCALGTITASALARRAKAQLSALALSAQLQPAIGQRSALSAQRRADSGKLTAESWQLVAGSW